MSSYFIYSVSDTREMNQKFIVFVMGLVLLVSISTLVQTQAQVEEQEGNLNGKIAKMQDVVDACSTMAEQRGSEMEAVQEVLTVDCSKVLDAFNLVMSDVLRNNSESIENILYGR
jgi:hypothetical protein